MQKKIKYIVIYTFFITCLLSHSLAIGCAEELTTSKENPPFAEYISFPIKGKRYYGKIKNTELQLSGVVIFHIELLTGEKIPIIFPDLSLVESSEEARRAFEERDQS